MSSVRGGSMAGRGRGGNGQSGNARGASSVRGRGLSRGRATRGGSVSSRGPKTLSGAKTINPSAGPASKAQSVMRTAQNTQKSAAGTNEDIADRYARLKRDRDQERADAIKRGLLADPDKPRALADAITPVGTCQDMCAEYERVERAVRNEVWEEEKDQNHSAYSRTEAPMDEYRMVKIFKRSAAGDEEQLPSDLRPPTVLMRTCDYLFNDLIGNSPSLAKVHNFVWNRTRAIRRDFSIQQLSKPEDLQIAIDCYERIARFHILSLHELAQANKPYPEYDYKQDREQLDKTLLSLMQYYDDSRSRVNLRNEAEFRAYCVIFQLQDFTPDLEDRVQTWPASVAGDTRVQTALQVYAAAGSATDVKGPLKTSAIEQFHAQQDWRAFFTTIESTAVSFLLGCVAEIFFNHVRHQVLDCLVRSAPRLRAKGPNNANHFLDLEELVDLLAFDDQDEVIRFCGRYDFPIVRQDDGCQYVNISSSAGVSLSAPQAAAPPLKSSLVENKRYGRTFPALINGLNVQAACEAGLVREVEYDQEAMQEEDMDDVSEDSVNGADEEEEEDAHSLFIPDTSKSVLRETSPFSSATKSASAQPPTPTPTSFGFGKPSGGTQPTSTFRSPFAPASNIPSTAPETEQQSVFSSFAKPVADATAVPSGLGNSILTPKAQSPILSTGFNFLSKPQNDNSTTSTPLASPFAPSSGVFSRKEENSAKSAEAAATPLFQWSSKAETGASPTASNHSIFDTKPASPTSPFDVGQSNSAQPTSSQTTGIFHAAPLTKLPAPTPAENSNAAPPVFSAFQISNPIKDGGRADEALTFLSPASNPPLSLSPSTLSTDSAPDPLATTALQSQPSQLMSNAGSKANVAQQSPNSLSVDEQKLRRNSETTRPRKPSPLAHSFSASDDSTNERTLNNHFGAYPIDSEPGFALSDPVKINNGAPNATTKNPARLEAIVDRLANEMTNDPYRGIITQFVEFFASQVITQTQEKVYAERVNKEADDFRLFSLSFRYGKKWRESARRARLARQGRERRRRAQERLRESSVRSVSDAGSVADGNTASNRVARVSTSSRSQSISRQTEIDALFQSTNGGSHYSAERLASAGSKRPAASTLDASNSTSEQGHKRIKSDDHNASRHLTISNANKAENDLARRSAFLGFSLPRDAVDRGSTTKSSYFKLKAMGINPNAGAVALQAAGRQRSESVNIGSPRLDPNPQALLKLEESDVRGSSPTTGRMLPPPSRRPRTRLSDPDEALFARLKAAREGLKDESILMKSTTSQQSNSPPSVVSRPNGDSPSLVLARAEARLRASRSSYGSTYGSVRKERDVPAYRLRESRFVPKEHYARAIERANAVRSTRSRASSQAGSQMGDSQPPSPINISQGNYQSQNSYVREHLDRTQPVSPLLEQSQTNELPPALSRIGWNGSDAIASSPAQKMAFPQTQDAAKPFSRAIDIEDPPAPAPSFATSTLEQLQHVTQEQQPHMQLDTNVHDQYPAQAFTYSLPPFAPQPDWSFASTTELATPTQDGSRRPSQDLLVAQSPDGHPTLDPELESDRPPAHTIQDSQMLETRLDAAPQEASLIVDQTIPVEKIPAALSASFGAAPVPPHLDLPRTAEDPDLFVAAKDSIPQLTQPHDTQPSFSMNKQNPPLKQKSSFASINRYAALAGDEEDSEGEEQEVSDTEVDAAAAFENEVAESDIQSRANHAASKIDHRAQLYDEVEDVDEDEDMLQDESGTPVQNGVHRTQGESSEGSEGDIEDFDEEFDEEEEGEGIYEDEYDSEMDEEDIGSGDDDQSEEDDAATPPLQGVGGTADEAIELSD